MANKIDPTYEIGLVDLYENHRKLISWYIKKFIKSDDVDDIIQDAFLGALEAKDRYKNDCNLKNWVLAICRYAALNRINSAANSLIDYVGDPPDVIGESDTEMCVHDRIMVDRLLGALQRMPEEDKNVLLLTKVQGETERAVAQILGIGLSTVGWKVRNARLFITKAIGLYE